MIPSGQTALTIGVGDSAKTCFVTESPVSVWCRSVRWSFSTFEVKPRTTRGGGGPAVVQKIFSPVTRTCY
jgi:hypothetical protein